MSFRPLLFSGELNVHFSMYVCVYVVCMGAWMYVYICVLGTCLYVYVCFEACMFVCMFVCMYVFG